MTTSLPTSPAPLSPEQFTELEKAKLRAKKVRRAAAVAVSDGYVTAFFAVGALLSGLCSIDALLLGLAMAAIAANSFQSARLLKRFDLRAPKRLAMGQLALFIAITIYALYNWYMLSSGRNNSLNDAIHQVIGDPGQLNSDPAIAEAVNHIKLLVVWIPAMLYGGLIFGTLVGQGLTGLYYITRRHIVEEYIETTPPWILEMQRRGLA